MSVIKWYNQEQLVDAFTKYYQLYKNNPSDFDDSYEDEPSVAAKNVVEFVVDIMERTV